ncbi:class I SAM-dependent methyltransferase [Corynebacterium sp. LK2510]|uniref:class I SAM-dependent methyltransferase n=1 Tax=Corynebacterium sp. LK2510 TaxID=3110472 RepID=UPI0034CEB6DA
MKPSRKDAPAFRDASERISAAATYRRGAENYHLARPSYPDEVTSLLPPGGTILDVGAGTGKLTELLLQADRSVYACDPSAEMTKVLRRALPDVPVWRATAEDTALADASVDAVVAAQVWHWVDPDRASAEAHRVVRDGGHLMLCWNTLDVSHPWVLRLSRIMHSGDVLREGFYPTVAAPWRLIEERRVSWIQPVTTGDLFDLMATRSYWMRSTEKTRATMTNNLTWYLYERLGFDEGQLLPLPYRTDAFVYAR